jgi:hypothetical protein
MWMDAYVEYTLIRDRLAQTQRQAARRHLVHVAKASRPPGGVRVALRRAAHVLPALRLKRLMERMASS